MLTKSDLAAIRQQLVVVTCSSDEDFIGAANHILPGFQFVKLASQLREAAEFFGFAWEQADWYLYNGSGNGSILYLYYQASTMWGSISLARDICYRPEGLVADHAYLNLPVELQGNGLSKYLNSVCYEQYRQAGVVKIEVYATLDAGGYVWARAGFAATKRPEVEAIVALAYEKTTQNQTTRLTHALCDVLQKEVSLHYGLQPDKPFPIWRWATLGFGEELLLKTSWHGELDLTDEVQVRIFKKYLGSEQS